MPYIEVWNFENFRKKVFKFEINNQNNEIVNQRKWEYKSIKTFKNTFIIQYSIL